MRTTMKSSGRSRRDGGGQDSSVFRSGWVMRGLSIQASQTVPPTTRGQASKLSAVALKASGAEGDRTLNLSIANAALSQLSYRPSAAGHE